MPHSAGLLASFPGAGGRETRPKALGPSCCQAIVLPWPPGAKALQPAREVRVREAFPKNKGSPARTSDSSRSGFVESIYPLGGVDSRPASAG